MNFLPVRSVLLLTVLDLNASAADWPQWRGPERDGVIRGEKSLDKFPAAPKKLWEIPAGLGHSAIVISGKRFVYIDQGGDKEVVHVCDLATGKEIWKNAYAELAPYYNYGTGPRTTPVIDGDTVTISSTSIGMTRYRIAKAGGAFTITPEWTNPEVRITISSSVQVGDKIFGIGTSKGQSKSDYVCVDVKTGKTLWSKPGFGDYASTTALGDKLLVLNSDGEMFLLAADPTGYKELSRFQPCGKTYSHPAIVDGKLIVRDNSHIFAIALPGT